MSFLFAYEVQTSWKSYKYYMTFKRINEDFLDSNSDVLQIQDGTDSQRCQDICELQDKRPVSDILSEYNIILNIELEIYDDQQTIENYVYGFSRKLMNRLNYFAGLDVSKVVIGSRLTERQFEYKDTGFSYFNEYIML